MGIKERLRVVLVEDDESLRRLIPPILAGYAVDATTHDRVPARAECRDPDVVVLDLGLRDTGGTDGFESVEAARHRWPLAPIVVWTGRSNPRELASWIAEGAIDSFVIKGDTRGEELAVAIWQAYGRDEGRTPTHAINDLAVIFEEMSHED